MAKTRKDKARELFELASRGPSVGIDMPKTEAEMKNRYNLWASTWMLPLLTELVPELKGKKFDYASSRDQTKN